MPLRQFLLMLAAVVIYCSLSPAAPPDGKEPAKEGKAVGKPVLVPVWKKTTVGLPEEETQDTVKSAGNGWTNLLYRRVEAQSRNYAWPQIPPASPKVAGGLVVYSTDGSLSARAISKITSVEPPCIPGELYWQTERDRGLLQMTRDQFGRSTIDLWLRHATKEELQVCVIHRTLCHSFTIGDDGAAYVDDIGLLPQQRKKDDNSPSPVGAFSFYMRGNILKQVDLETGKIKQKAGESDNQLLDKEVFYLSAPLIKGSTWFLVSEQFPNLLLLALDWAKHGLAVREHFREKGAHDRALAAGRKWETQLIEPREGVKKDSHRRIHAIQLISTNELIISPTNLGRVVAVEAKTGKIKWTHEYASLDAKRFPTIAPEWVVVPPVVVGDKYIYAPADFPELLCLNVADGKKVWGAKKGDGLYPAVVGEQVLVIGEKTVRSLDLKDGSEKWKVDLPGLPCGRGAVLGDHYLVPVSEPKTWRGMIAMVDVKAGKVSEVIKPDKDEPVGNLVVHQDFLISQTLTEIAVFPIKK